MWVQRDAEQEMLDLLGSFVGDPGKVTVALPDGWSPAKGDHVTVESDGTPISERSWTRETLRVTVHGRDKPRVGKLMRLIDGFILTPHMGHFLSVKPGAGVLVAPDSKVGGFVASATYRVAMPRINFPGGGE